MRETKEMVEAACEATFEAAAALERAKHLFETEFERYCEIFYDQKPRHIEGLIEELKVSSGMLEIVSATVDAGPKDRPFTRLFLSGNDERTFVVESAYRMSTFWDGPKLVTTPGSKFADLCSVLFEAVSGHANESLSGAINRYARSDERRQWDKEGDDLEDDDDNFAVEKQVMRGSRREIEFCQSLIAKPELSSMAKTLLTMRVGAEQRRYEEARDVFGPRQVYLEQHNPEQLEAMFAEAIGSLSPERLVTLGAELAGGTSPLEILASSMAASDISRGKARRSGRKAGG